MNHRESSKEEYLEAKDEVYELTSALDELGKMRRENELLKEKLKKHKEEPPKKEQIFISQLKGKVVEVISLKEELETLSKRNYFLIDQLQKTQEEIEKATKVIDEQMIQPQKRQEEVEGLRNGIAGLNGEMQRLKMKERMNEIFKKIIEVLNNILSEQRLPCDKSGIGFFISRKSESKTLKFSQDKVEEKAKNYVHGEGSNEREDHIQHRHGFRNSMPQARSFNSKYQSTFYGYCFSCNEIGHKAVNCRTYARNSYVTRRNSYKDFNNNEHKISRNFSITKKSPNKIWRRKEANGKPKQEKEKESAYYPVFLNPSMKKIVEVKSKKIWKNKDNHKEIYTHGELKECQEENKGTSKTVLKLAKVDQGKVVTLKDNKENKEIFLEIKDPTGYVFMNRTRSKQPNTDQG